MVKRYDVLKMLYEKPQLYLKDVEPEKLKDFKAVAKQLGIEGYVRTPISLSGAYSLTERGRAYYLDLASEEQKLNNSDNNAEGQGTECTFTTSVPDRDKAFPKAVKFIVSLVSFLAAVIAIIEFFA